MYWVDDETKRKTSLELLIPGNKVGWSDIYINTDQNIPLVQSSSGPIGYILWAIYSLLIFTDNSKFKAKSMKVYDSFLNV